MKLKHFIGLLLGTYGFMTSCSSTSGVLDGDQLYTGLSKIEYTHYEKGSHFTATREEVEAALACKPNS